VNIQNVLLWLERRHGAVCKFSPLEKDLNKVSYRKQIARQHLCSTL